MRVDRQQPRWKLVLLVLALTVPLTAVWYARHTDEVAASGTVYVATTGNDANAGTLSAPKRTVAAAVRQVTNGGSIILRGGTYRESVQIFSKTVHISSHPGERATFDGSVPLTTWVSSGSRWYTSGWTRQFAKLTASPVDPAVPIAGHPDEVFRNGAPLRQVTSLSAVTPGTFFHDEAADRIWVGDNPATATMSAASLEWALYFNQAHGSSLRNVTVQRYATPSTAMAAIRGYADNLVFEGVTSINNAYSGISVMGNNIRIASGLFRDNGYLGVHGFQVTNFVLELSGLIGNNRNRFDPLHSAAGVKLATGSNLVFRNNYVANNHGPGIWTDIGSYNIDIAGNLIENNFRSGIEVELSGQVDVVDNVTLNNGEAGIWILESNNVNVYNNAAFDNVRDIYVLDGPRTSTTANATVRWDTYRVDVFNNVVGGGGRPVQAFVHVDDWTERRSGHAMGVNSNSNAFWRPPTSRVANIYRWARWPSPLAVSATLPPHVAATTEDANSIMSTASTNPYARNIAALDYRTPPGTPNGQPLVAGVASLVGLAAGSLVPIGPITPAQRITAPGAVLTNTVTSAAPAPTTVAATTTTAPATTTTAPVTTTTAPVTTTTAPVTTTTAPVTTTTAPATTLPPPPASEVVRIAPERMLDTNAGASTVDGTFSGLGAWPAGSTFTTPIAGRGSVPADAQTVLLSVSATAGSITVYPCGAARPAQTTLDVASGATFGMTVLAVGVGTAGSVCIDTTATTHLTATVTGYLAKPFSFLPRTRILDTRPTGTTVDGTYRRLGTWPAGSVFTLPVAGRGGVPLDATHASLALRITDPQGAGSVVMFPCGGSSAGLPAVNVSAGASAWLNDVVRLDSSGRVCIATTATVHLTVDAMGWVS